VNGVRFPLIVLLLLSTQIFLFRHERGEILAPRQKLAGLPQQLGSWEGTDLPIAEDVRQILGNGDFLSRIYRDQGNIAGEYVDLFIAYFPTQRFGDTIHSPKNCLPGSGWLPIESRKVTLSLAGVAPFLANRYVVAKGENQQLVLYWYSAHGRSIASEYWARYYLLADSIALDRSDGALIRLGTPISSGQPLDVAQQRLLVVANEIAPLLNAYIPR
jgi:EpsI family protein